MTLLKSKKFQVALVGIVVLVIGHFIPDIDEATLTKVTAVIVAYLLGQGLADSGKEANK